MIRVNNKSDFERELRKSKHALVLFCASWCPFCRNFFPVFDKLISKYSFDSVIRFYIDDYNDPSWDEFTLDAVPTVILFNQTKTSSRLDAELGIGLTEKQFSRWLQQLK